MIKKHKDPRVMRERERDAIITAIFQIVVYGFAFLGLIAVICGIIGLFTSPKEKTPQVIDKTAVLEELPQEQAFEIPEEQIFTLQDEEPAETEEPAFTARYELTDEERQEVASVVMAEAGNQPYDGMLAVAQCILQFSEDHGVRPTEAVIKAKYTKKRPEPSEEVLAAVADVFDNGKTVTDEPIKYFYAPAICESEWHETQVYVLTIKDHRFFAERKI